MVTLYGTLGFTPEKFYPPLRRRDDVERAVLFHDDHERSQSAARAVARYCKDLDIPLDQVQVDVFDLAASTLDMQAAVRASPGGPAVFNITGGTKVLTAAALLTCIMEGIPALYVHDATDEEIPLPLLTMPYQELLSPSQKAVLAYISKHEGCTQTGLRDGLGITKPTVSHHVQGLVRLGLVQEGRDPHDARKKRLRLVPSARLLLGPQMIRPAGPAGQGPADGGHHPGADRTR